MMAFLQIIDLEVRFDARGLRGRGAIRAVDGVSFEVDEGETVGLVGESGSGKSTIGRAIFGLDSSYAGSILFRGEDITRARRRRRVRLARDIQAVFQDPYSSLDPRFRIIDTLLEPLLAQRDIRRAAAHERIGELLSQVRLPEDAAHRLPRDFSGGQRQRIAIARALATNPALVVCDEAVSSLDLSTQAQVINLLATLQRELGLSYLFISHDLAAVKHFCTRIVVLYRGRVMESGPAGQVGETPLHPYTRALLAAAPVSDPAEQRRRRAARLAATTMNSAPPNAKPGQRCPFASRCPAVAEVCWTTRPRNIQVRDTTTACHLYDPESGHIGAVVSLADSVAHPNLRR